MDSIGVQLPILSRLVFCVPEEIALWSWKSRLPPASDLSVVTLESNYQFRPRLLCLPVFVLQALEWQDWERLSTNLSRFSLH